MSTCTHVVTNYLRPPETEQNMLYLSPYRWPVLNSAKFRENTEEIQRKQENSVAQLKILRSAKNCSPYSE